ncbi:hypothetical protein BJX70DRAFT_361395 [Aspergillus crustosus]
MLASLVVNHQASHFQVPSTMVGYIVDTIFPIPRRNGTYTCRASWLRLWELEAWNSCHKSIYF